jgi:hypothetical protein
MVREHDKVGIQVLLAAPPTPLCKALSRHGFFKRFSSERLFPTVTSAVSFARDGNRVVSEKPYVTIRTMCIIHANCKKVENTSSSPPAPKSHDLSHR